jgi:hypothetical protein
LRRKAITKGDEHETSKRKVGYFAAVEKAKAVGVRQELRSWQYSRIQEVRRENQRETSAFCSERDHQKGKEEQEAKGPKENLIRNTVEI